MFDRNPREMNRPDAATLDERYAYHCAAEYRDRGWSVIPLCGKKPLLPSWRAFQQRTSTLGEIAVWFGGPVSDMPGVGIVTGGCSGLVVIDCDAPEDAEYWLTNFAPSPLMVRTGGGGMHVYYRMPESDTIGNRTRLFGRKIDVRGEGGYVCAPAVPSRERHTIPVGFVGRLLLGKCPVLGSHVATSNTAADRKRDARGFESRDSRCCRLHSQDPRDFWAERSQRDVSSRLYLA